MLVSWAIVEFTNWGCLGSNKVMSRKGRAILVFIVQIFIYWNRARNWKLKELARDRENMDTDERSHFVYTFYIVSKEILLISLYGFYIIKK